LVATHDLGGAIKAELEFGLYPTRSARQIHLPLYCPSQVKEFEDGPVETGPRASMLDMQETIEDESGALVTASTTTTVTLAAQSFGQFK